MNVNGHYTKIGDNKGKYYNINIPFNTGFGLMSDDVSPLGDAEYVFICKNFLLPIIKEFDPELIFISAGFDSAKGDPLGNLSLYPSVYYYMTTELMKIQPYVIVALEGGYNLQSISDSAEAEVRALLYEKNYV